MAQLQSELIEPHLDWLVEEWTGKLVEALAVTTGKQPEVSWKPTAASDPQSGAPEAGAADSPAAASEKILWWKQSFNVEPEFAFWIGAPKKAWKEIGRLVPAQEGAEDPEPEQLKEAYLKILGQSLTKLAVVVGDRLGKEVVCAKGEESSETPTASEWLEVSVLQSDETHSSLLVAIGRGLLDALRLAEDSQETPLPAGNTMDLLLDVELPVSVSFGSSQMPLKDVVKLTTGSIIELSRAVSEPVEIIVNNCTFARGEVVVVDGNYGVRIQQIISRQDRLETVK